MYRLLKSKKRTTSSAKSPPWWPALVTTGYGPILLAKIGAVAVLLAAAAVNKLRFVPAMRRGNRMAAAGPCRSIALERAAIFFVLMATAARTTVQGVPARGSP